MTEPRESVNEVARRVADQNDKVRNAAKRAAEEETVRIERDREGQEGTDIGPDSGS